MICSFFSLLLRQTQRIIRQRYASSIKRHRLGVIQEEEEEEPQEEINSNNESVNDLSEVIIENQATIAKEKEKVIQNRRDDLEMRSPERNTRLRSLDRNAADKLEVSFTYKLSNSNFKEYVGCVASHTDK